MMHSMKWAALAAAMSLCAGVANAACDTAPLVEQCKGKLSEGFTVMSTFALDGKDGKVTSVRDDNVLTSRMTYEVAVCGSNDSNIEFVLETGMGEKIATNKSGDTFQQVTTIKPERMSVYFLVFNAQAPAEFCGGAVLGGKK